MDNKQTLYIFTLFLTISLLAVNFNYEDIAISIGKSEVPDDIFETGCPKNMISCKIQIENLGRIYVTDLCVLSNNNTCVKESILDSVRMTYCRKDNIETCYNNGKFIPLLINIILSTCLTFALISILWIHICEWAFGRQTNQLKTP